MDKRSGYLAGAVVGANALVSQYVFDIDLGGFSWGLALMTLVFAIALLVTPADDKPSTD